MEIKITASWLGYREEAGSKKRVFLSVISSGLVFGLFGRFWFGGSEFYFYKRLGEENMGQICTYLLAMHWNIILKCSSLDSSTVT